MRAFSVTTNDQMMVIYLSSLIRAIIALHDLINNKIANREAERSSESLIAEKEKGKKACARALVLWCSVCVCSLAIRRMFGLLADSVTASVPTSGCCAGRCCNYR